MKRYQKTEEQIRQAFETITVDQSKEILSDCVQQKGRIFIMNNQPGKQTWNRRLVVFITSVLLVSGIAFFYQTTRINQTIAASITLDVNPSIEITVNQKERVLSVIPHNEEAKIVIGDMDFSGSDLDVTVNALIGSMLRNGYLNEITNSILVSVEDNNLLKGAELQEKLSDEINLLLAGETFDGAILSQTVKKDDTLLRLADDYNISVGKAQLIQDIIAQQPLYQFSELNALSITELNLLHQNNVTDTNISSIGKASDKAYIGSEEAKSIAMQHAQLSINQIQWSEVKLDYEHGMMIYEVTFTVNQIEYEYDIDATTGAILQAETEWDDDLNKHDTVLPDTTLPIDQTVPVSSYIGEAKAKSLALSHAQISADDIREYEIELDHDDVPAVYEIEFKSGTYEYHVEIHAENGSVLDYEKELDD